MPAVKSRLLFLVSALLLAAAYLVPGTWMGMVFGCLFLGTLALAVKSSQGRLVLDFIFGAWFHME